MDPIKYSMIASLVGISVGVQQVDDALRVSDKLSLKNSQDSVQHLKVSNRPICVPGFPKVPEEFDKLEFKIFRGHARAFGFNEIKLFALAHDQYQAQRLVDIFTLEYDKFVRAKRNGENGAVSHMYEEDISPDEVIKIADNFRNIYTLFNEQLFT